MVWMVGNSRPYRADSPPLCDSRLARAGGGALSAPARKVSSQARSALTARVGSRVRRAHPLVRHQQIVHTLEAPPELIGRYIGQCSPQRGVVAAGERRVGEEHRVVFPPLGIGDGALRPALRRLAAGGDGGAARRWALIGLVLTVLAIGMMTRALYAGT